MARALIIGCGCRGRLLGKALEGRGWAVRGTSRNDAGVAAIERIGLEGVYADPALPGTVLDHVVDAALVVHLLGRIGCGGASDDPDELHSERLSSLLRRLVDSPVRAFAYEPGSGAARTGRDVVEEAAATWHIPIPLIPDAGDLTWTEWAELSADACLEPLR